MSKTIIANWKMNLSVKESILLGAKVAKIKTENDIIICPDFLSLSEIKSKIKENNIYLGAQNCAAYSPGSYTGEVLAKSISEIGASYVIIGHSERRKFQKESNTLINNKIKQALQAGLKVILCIGENNIEKKNDKTNFVLNVQLKEALKDLEKTDLARISIAYEPVWAIGSGRTPKIEELNTISTFIKSFIYSSYQKRVKVFYGGSVNANNAGDFLETKTINGLLIGGASLNYPEFSKICKKNYDR